MIIVLATHNLHKQEELEQVLQRELGSSIEIRTLKDIEPAIGDIEETGSTLEENALIKTRAVFVETGLPTLADDTGLEVATLNGEPGVYSARYAGLDSTYSTNIDKLLAKLEGKSDRSARFRTVIAYTDKTGCERVFDGVVDGVIIESRRGIAGFGYDAVFQPIEDDEQRTFAQMSAEEKNAISHRGRALKNFCEYLKGAMAVERATT